MVVENGHFRRMPVVQLLRRFGLQKEMIVNE